MKITIPKHIIIGLYISAICLFTGLTVFANQPQSHQQDESNRVASPLVQESTDTVTLNALINDANALIEGSEGVNEEDVGIVNDPDATNTRNPEATGGEGRLRDEFAKAPDVSSIISIGKIFWSLVFVFVGYFFLKLISGMLALVSERNVNYKPAIRRSLPVIKIAGWSFIVYIIISAIFQPPPETVFAFFASVGVAIGFASQDLLKNIFGGLMILFDKPFQIGDKIESGKYYGEVLEVGLRSTRVVTPDDSIVTIPNSEMMNQSISNANSSENNCQVVAEFFIPVTTDTKRARQIATEAAQISRYVYLNKPISVEFSNVLVPKGSFLKMRLKAYVNDVRFEFPFQSEMTEIVLREMTKEGMLEGL
jgi:MscS family membrane protein